jgi:hypothetical protein
MEGILADKGANVTSQKYLIAASKFTDLNGAFGVNF